MHAYVFYSYTLKKASFFKVTVLKYYEETFEPVSMSVLLFTYTETG